MTRDPVCGMGIDKQRTRYKTEYQGKTYFFCSQHCMDLFKKDPETILKNKIHVSAEKSRKVVIVGAGQVGATFAFNLMISGIASDIILVDINKELAEGQVLDLNHGLSFVPPCSIHSGDLSECRNADIVVVTAGANQKPGETRIDLVKKNTDIFKSLIPDIVKFDPHILLIVTNPVDVLTYVTLKLSGLPMNRILGSGTVLDTARFRYQLSSHCGVDPRNVHAYILGEHGDSEVPIWSRIHIGGVLLKDYCPICGRGCLEKERDQLFEQVKNAAYQIINKKGATNFAISLALVRITGSILRDENRILTVSTLLDGYYDIEQVCLSVPVLINRNGISKIIQIQMNEQERQKFQKSARELKKVIHEIGF